MSYLGFLRLASVVNWGGILGEVGNGFLEGIPWNHTIICLHTNGMQLLMIWWCVTNIFSLNTLKSWWRSAWPWGESSVRKADRCNRSWSCRWGFGPCSFWYWMYFCMRLWFQPVISSPSHSLAFSYVSSIFCFSEAIFTFSRHVGMATRLLYTVEGLVLCNHSHLKIHCHQTHQITFL